MKFNAVARTMAASAVALLIAGCGGGGGGDAPSLEVKGTAAVGAALSGAAVAVKCATGSGTGTTTATGSYTVAMPGAALPCIIQVSGEVGGVAVKLHSVAEAGTGSGSTTTAVANVTPVTEMIVAQLLASLPADAFASFDAQKVTTAAITTAVTAIVDALKAAGVDLGSINPLKAELVPANGSTAGNDYDKALDALGDKVPPESLPLLVNQIANASASGSSEGLGDAMVAVSGGSLEGCAVALSGKYRTLEFRGATAVHTVDFKAMTITTDGHSETITKGSEACEFTVGPTKIVVGPGGAGAFRSSEDVGYFFPVQSHALSSVTGNWNFAESGLNESNVGEHFVGKFTFNADGSASVCEYDLSKGLSGFSTCEPDTDETITVAAASDGSFDLKYGTDASKIYGYRSPSGALNLFGSNNPGADYSSTAFRTHFLMVRPGPTQLPAVGTVTKYWDTTIAVGAGGVLTIPELVAGSNTVIAADASTGTFTRSRASGEDSWQVNQPVEGMRYRASASGISSVFLMLMPGLGIGTVLDNHPTAHFYGVSVTRP